MSAKPPVHLVIAALAERDAETAGRVVRRVAGAMAPGAFAELLAVPVALSDAFVRVVAEHGAAEDVVALAGNPHLTARQLAWLLEAGGEDIRRKAFDPDQPLPFSARTLAEMRAEAEGEASPDGSDTSGAAHGGVPGNVADGAWLRIREADCGADEAVRLLAAHPEVAYTARVRADPAPGWRSRHADLRPLLHDPDVPRSSSAEIAPAVESALALGAVDPAALWTRMSPALVAVQVLAKLTREHAAQFARESDADAMLRPLLARTLGTKPEAWAALAARLARAEVPLSVLLDEIASSPDGATRAAPTVITASAKVRPALLFLIRRLDIADVEAVLPHLDGDLVRDLIQGHVPIPAEVIELAHRSGHPVLLAKAAGHQHLRDAEARRFQAYEDPRLDRILAFNKAGVSAAVRREVLGGVSPGGGPRRPMDPELRQAVIDDPGSVEDSTLVYCGDPALVCAALPRVGRLRRIDQLDVLLALWERGGGQAVEGVLTSVPDGLAAPIVKKAQAALAAGTPDTLIAERAKLHARTKPPVPRPREEWDHPPDERVRKYPLEAQESRNQWLRFVDPEPLLAAGNPAAPALAALLRHCADGRAADVRAALDAHAVRHLGSEPEAWAVFVQLLPEFAGTVAELAQVCAAVGTPAAGAES